MKDSDQPEDGQRREASRNSAAAPPPDESAEPGAPPSNTAPSNSISSDESGFTRIFAAGIDSLYLSIQGKLTKAKTLKALKERAGSFDPETRSLAQFPYEGQLFTVGAKGWKLFTYVLWNENFRICLGSPEAQKIPYAFVQLKSRAIAEYGIANLVENLRGLLWALGAPDGSFRVSRIDLFVDAYTDHSLDDIPDRAWVCRPTSIARYSERGQRSGYTVGRGGDISLRLYDKTLEMEMKGTGHADELWRKNGYEGQRPIYRTEVQFTRNILRELKIETIDQALIHSAALWQYAVGVWCRLCTPGKDKTRSRWPTHPFWAAVQAAEEFANPNTELKRVFSSGEPPRDDYLAQRMMGLVTSEMAATGDYSWSRAVCRLTEKAKVYYFDEDAERDASYFAGAKTAEKTRQYGTGRGAKVPQQIELELDLDPNQLKLPLGKPDGKKR